MGIMGKFQKFGKKVDYIVDESEKVMKEVEESLKPTELVELQDLIDQGKIKIGGEYNGKRKIKYKYN